MLQKPFGYAVFVVSANDGGGGGFQFFGGVLNSVSFVRSAEHIKVVFAVAEDDELLAAELLFQLSRTAFALEAVFGMISSHCSPE